MTWIAVNDRSTDKPDDGDKQQADVFDSGLMTQGSIIVDFDFSLRQKAPSRLLSYCSDNGWNRRFTVFLNADYSLSVEAHQGDSSCYAMIAGINLREAGAVRMTYAWDSPNKTGCLTLDCAEDGAIHQVPIHAPIPIPLGDAISIVHGSEDVAFDERTRNLALNDAVVPVGPTPSLAKGVLVDTEFGQYAIERLRLGDLVLTKDNGPQPVRWIVRHEMPAMGPSAPVRLRAPFFGLVKDLVVAGNQRVLISGNETEYYFGQEAMLIEAKNLIGHPAVAPIIGQRTMIYYQIVFDNHECMCLSGVWADSMYVGHLGQWPEIVKTTLLADVPASAIPLHRTYAHHILRSYERQALLDSLST